MTNLECVLHRLAIMGFKLKCSKLELGKKKIDLLGFQISKSGVEIDPLKQRAASLWKRPVTQKEVLSFVQFCNFMRKFIENFALLAKPLYDLCNAKAFEWSQGCEESFLALRKAVVEAPALRLPDFSKTVYATADYCRDSVAYALLQRENDRSVVCVTIRIESFDHNPEKRVVIAEGRTFRPQDLP